MIFLNMVIWRRMCLRNKFLLFFFFFLSNFFLKNELAKMLCLFV